MLTIKFSPVRSDEDQVTASWNSPIITVNSVDYDLSLLSDGATAVHPVLGDVSRVGDDYKLTLILYHGPNAPYSTRFPEDLVLESNGDVTIPIYNEEI